MQLKFYLILGEAAVVSASSIVNATWAQVVLIPQGDFEGDFEKYLVALISFVLLGFAAWRFFRRGR